MWSRLPRPPTPVLGAHFIQNYKIGAFMSCLAYPTLPSLSFELGWLGHQKLSLTATGTRVNQIPNTDYLFQQCFVQQMNVLCAFKHIVGYTGREDSYSCGRDYSGVIKKYIYISLSACMHGCTF